MALPVGQKENAGTSAVPLVLVVEDEVLIRLDVVQALHEAGFPVLEAADAEEAAALVEGGHPVDVLFSDVQLGAGPDGVALARRLHRRLPALSIVLTSAAPETARSAELDEGLWRFVAKPYRAEAVPALLAAAAERA
jgi:CheY-like chemotaxis protein